MFEKAINYCIGFYRCRLGTFCPKCNSSAPDMHTCTVCSKYEKYDYSTLMEKIVRDQWWWEYKKELDKTYDR